MEITKLYINCKKHGRQLAIATVGGEIWCQECQKEWDHDKYS